MVEAVKGSVRQYLTGLKDSFYGLTHIFQLDKKIAEQNRKKRQRMQDDLHLRRHRSRIEARRRPLHSSNPTSTSRPVLSSKTEYGLLECLCLNTAMNILIWIAIWGFYEYLVPWLKLLMERLMLSSNSNGEEMETTKQQWEIVEKLLQYIFSSLWVLPLYFISKIVNALYFVDLSNAIYQYYRGQPQAFPSTGRMIADLVFSIAVESVFLLQANLAKDILVFDMAILFHIHHCLLYALYAFEYKWFNMGLDFRLRVQLIETHWPYFCGFGTPLFILTHLSFRYYSILLSACVFSFVFPFFIISATKAETPSETPAFRFYIIEVSIRICDAVFKLVFNPKTTGESRRHVPHSPPPG